MIIPTRHWAGLAASLLALSGSAAAQPASVDTLSSFEYLRRGAIATIDPAPVPQLAGVVSFRSHDNTVDLFAGIQGNALVVYRRATDGMVFQSSSGPAPPAALELAVGRFDRGDAHRDVLALEPGQSLRVWTNDGSDNFARRARNRVSRNAALTRVTTIPRPSSPRADAVLLWGPGTTAAEWIDDPMGGSARPIAVSFPFPPTTVTAGDIDGDGVTDLVIASADADSLQLFVGSPPGWLTYPIVAGRGPSSVTIVTTPGDPNADLLVTNAVDGTVSALIQDTVPRHHFSDGPRSPLHVGTWPTDAIRVGATDEFLVHQADSAVPVSIVLTSATGGLRFVGSAPYVPGRVLGLTPPGATRATLEPEIARVAMLCGEGPALLQALIGDLDLALISTPIGAEGCIIAELRRSREFTGAEPDWILRSILRNVNSLQDWVSDDLNLPSAHQHTEGDSNIIVAVLDSGIEGNMLIASNPLEVADGVDNDGNGFIDDLDGLDIVEGAWVPGPDQDLFVSGPGALEDAVPSLHGTLVAAAVARVAPLATHMPIKVLDADKETNSSTVALGLHYAQMRGARIMSLSLAGPNDSEVLRNTVRRVRAGGAIVIGASGNDGDRGSVAYPGLYNEVIAVAAHERPSGGSEPRLWEGSNRGAGIELSAPGADVCITGLGCHTGTSMAAPFVAGTVALMLAIEPGLDPCSVRDILRSSAAEAGAPGYDLERGYGRLDVGAAVAATLARSNAPCAEPTADPIRWRVQRRDFESSIAPAKLGGVTRVHVVLDTSLVDRGE